ncbi:MAG: IMP dehydrogenase [archaeon]|jgi:IMP dehydrogenase
MVEKFLLEKAAKDGVALTFNDVRLRSGYAEVMPDLVNVETLFSKNVKLKIPIVSAAMDTVTESKMAINLAKLGGLGIIHKNLSIGEQAAQVAKVKYHLNGLIEKPIFVCDRDTISTIQTKMKEKGYSFSSFPVIDKNEKLVGILTGNDFAFCSDDSLLANEVMTPLESMLTLPSGTDFKKAYETMLEKKKKVMPLLNKDGTLGGLYVFSDVKRIITGSSEKYNTDSNGRLRVGAAIGTGKEALERATKLIEEQVDVLVIDTAHGDSKPVYDTLKEIKRVFPKVDVVVGNVSVGESAERLAKAGADGIKVGQGPGSICTTRIIAGIGRPQVSAIYDCAKAAEKYGVPICADGGIANSGDITIAIAAGANCVMMGSMLAGTDEAPGEKIFLQGQPWKNYRGMGSLGAMEIHKGSRERYGQNETGKGQLVPEGVEGVIPYKGKLKDVIFQYVGGLKRGMGYVGAATIQELREKGEFDRLTEAGLAESHPHDIKITKDSPNYKESRFC